MRCTNDPTHNCDLEGHCDCWYSNLECCACGAPADDIEDDDDWDSYDEDAFLEPADILDDDDLISPLDDDLLWDDDGSDEDKDDE